VSSALGIAGVQRRRYRKTTDSAHDLPIAPNILARQFDVTAIATTERVWAGDITYVATREGWLYLAVVLDLVSRRIIGWSMRPSMERTLVIDALRRAIANKRRARCRYSIPIVVANTRVLNFARSSQPTV